MRQKSPFRQKKETVVKKPRDAHPCIKIGGVLPPGVQELSKGIYYYTVGKLSNSNFQC